MSQARGREEGAERLQDQEPGAGARRTEAGLSRHQPLPDQQLEPLQGVREGRLIARYGASSLPGRAGRPPAGARAHRGDSVPRSLTSSPERSPFQLGCRTGVLPRRPVHLAGAGAAQRVSEMGVGGSGFAHPGPPGPNGEAPLSPRWVTEEPAALCSSQA